MNKLVINGKEIELSKETVESIVRALEEPGELVPESINLFTASKTGRIHIGFGERNQYLGYCHVHDTWEVLAFNYRGGKDRFRLVETTFAELKKGDVFLDDLDFKNYVENYHIKTSDNHHTYVSEDGDGVWDVVSLSVTRPWKTIYKVVCLDD